MVPSMYVHIWEMTDLPILAKYYGLYKPMVQGRKIMAPSKFRLIFSKLDQWILNIWLEKLLYININECIVLTCFLSWKAFTVSASDVLEPPSVWSIYKLVNTFIPQIWFLTTPFELFFSKLSDELYPMSKMLWFSERDLSNDVLQSKIFSGP